MMGGWLTRFLLRFRATLSGRHDRELREELQLHLSLLEEDYTAQGMPRDAARRRAYREFGNPTRFQEASHDLFSFQYLEDLSQDVRFSLREVRRSVGFTCVAVASLAIGIGAVTAAFAVLDAFMLRRLPVREPDRLVAFSTADRAGWSPWSYAFYTRARSSPEASFDIAATSDVNALSVQLPGVTQASEVRVSLVSANYFSVMGSPIELGRDLNGTDHAAPGSAAIAVISDAFWARWFGRAPGVLNKTIRLGDRTYDIVGVAGKGFTGPIVGHPCDVWVPLAMQPALMPGAPLLDDGAGTNRRWLTVLGRLRPGVASDEATSAANLIHQRFVTDRAAALGETSPQVAHERTQAVALLTAATGFAPERRRYGRPMVILSCITLLVFLVACANFMNLMLVRGERRRREFVIRMAIGCGRWRLIRQSATECIGLALAGGLLGLPVASWAATASVKQFAAMVLPVEFPIAVNGRLLAFTAACVAAAIAFGLWPSIRLARSAAVSAIQQPREGGQPRARALTARTMLIAQLATCTILLIGASLMLRTVINLRFQNLGFDRNVLLASISPGQAGYSGEAAEMLVQRVRERLSAVPGVQAIGISGPALLDYTNYWIDGSQLLTTDRGLVLPGGRWTQTAVGPGFFEAIGMTVVDGRTFDDRDSRPSADVAVINRSLATFLFNGENPIGRRIRINPRAPMLSVIGVVNDAKQTSPRDRDLGVVYSPLNGFNHIVLAVRTAGSPADMAPVVRHQLASIAADMPIDSIRTIAQVLDSAIAQERLMSTISLVLAMVVVAIGCIGLYALMSYNVVQRAHELGIRLALGATRTTIIAMVLRDGILLIVPALAIGMPLGMAASRQLSSQLYGVGTNDPWTLALVALALGIVALLATFRPARTASRIDPIVLLRNG